MTIFRDSVYGVLTAVTSPYWGYRMVRTGKHRTDWEGRFGHCWLPATQASQTVLIHAVSVGEVNATRTLVDGLKAKMGEGLRVVLSVSTDTGFARAKKLYGHAIDVVRYPYDFSWMVERFLDRVRPDLVLLMELELWPGFVGACEKRGVPVGVVNGRLSERSYKGYRRAKAVIGGTFAKLAVACVQDEDYAERFAAMGVAADRVHVTGTMKWDTAELVDEVAGMDALAEAMGIDRERGLVVCGSSGPGEEKMFVERLGDLKDGDGRPVQLLIAPRKPERFEEAAEVMGEGVVRRSERPDGEAGEAGGDRFLLDSIGDLRKAYALADAVVVGRSFCPLYGSDMMEPIALGKPTVVGPNTRDFADTMAKLLAGEGIVQLEGIDELRSAVEQVLGTEAGAAIAKRGREVIRRSRGATEKNVECVVPLLESV